MPPILNANQPVNTPYTYRREAEVSRTRDIGALAFLGGAGLGIYGLATTRMPQWAATAFMHNPRMLGWGLREATTTGLESSVIYGRKFGLGEWASGVPKWRWGEFGMNLAKMAEEISPSQILRTFGTYEHLTALTTRRGITYRFTAEEAMAHREYLSELVGRHLRRREMLGGITLEGGSLWLERNLAGNREQILKHAHLMMRRYVPRGAADPSFWHFGKIAPAYEETITGGRRLMPNVRLGLRADEAMTSSFLIGGGHTKTQATWRYLQATTRTWTQRFMKLMDDPFLGMLEAFVGEPAQMPPGSMLGKVAHVGSRAFKAARLQGRFGLGGVYTGSTMEMIGRWLLPERMTAGKFIEYAGQSKWRLGAIASLVGIPFAYHAIDQFLAGSEIIPTGGEGIGGLAARTYQGLTMLRAQTLGRVFGPIARAQERVAPGSTSITGILALPMAAGLTGTAIGYGQRLLGSLTRDPTAALEAARTPQRLGPILGKFTQKAFSRTARYGFRGLAIGAALAAPMIVGAAARLLGGLETPKELEDLYAGRKEVPIMASRWWTFGRTPYAGKKPEYYTQHWTVRARSRYMDEALFRGDESWLFKAVKKTPLLQDIVDPYYFEKLHYYDRPYPVTGPSDVGLGFLDSIYKATIGRIFKPVRYMHTEEWMGEEGPAAWEPRPMLAPDSTLGGTAPYKPRDPYAYDQLAKQTLDYYSDAIGIVGWIGRLGVRATVGETTEFDVRPELESASRISSIKRSYWDAAIGDPFGVTEAYRRLNPARDRGQYYSPIQNKMPEWLPGEEYFINFRAGDPYSKIKRGEARLPGPGYVALHTELEGISPDNYPDFYKFKILADVAPYSQQYKHYNQRMSYMAKQGELTQEEIAQVKQIRKQTRAIKTRKEFAEYMTEEDLRDIDASFVGRTGADYWDIVSRLETPVEQIMFPPIAPMAKFVHRRTALEDYERSQVYGTDLSFWNRVYDNFLRPGMWSFAHTMGYDGVPPHIRRQRDIEDYFDKLEYIKNTRLMRAAEEVGDADAARMYWEKTRETMVGMNPYGNPLWILRAMPKRERDYWKAFQAEEDPEKQARILELVPESLKEIYRASWLRRAAKQIGGAKRKRILSEKDQEEADKILRYVEEDMGRQGQPFSEDLLNEYNKAIRLGRAKPGRYADWYRQKEMASYFESHRLPDESWIGWDPRVDLEDVKMKYVREEGYDFHDYDLWEDRLYALTRKPYLTEATSQIDIGPTDSSWTTQRRLRSLLNSYDPDMLAVIPTLNGGKVQVNINDTKKDRLSAAIAGARFR